MCFAYISRRVNNGESLVFQAQHMLVWHLYTILVADFADAYSALLTLLCRVNIFSVLPHLFNKYINIVGIVVINNIIVYCLSSKITYGRSWRTFRSVDTNFSLHTNRSRKTSWSHHSSPSFVSFLSL